MKYVQHFFRWEKLSTLFFRSCTILLLLTQSSKWLWIITHHQYNFNCNILNWQMNFLIQKTTNSDYVTFELLLKFLNQWDDGFLQILFYKMLTRPHLSWILIQETGCDRLVFNYLDKPKILLRLFLFLIVLSK